MLVKYKYILILVACLLFLFSCEKKQQNEFILFDFETGSALDEFHWKCHTLFSISNRHAAHGEKTLKLELFPSSYPGLSPALNYNDWRGYEFFCFDVYNPGQETVKLVLRIDDKKQALEYSDRYNKSFEILPGKNRIEIPLGSLKTSNTQRPLKLKKIYRFLVFMVNPDEKYVLYLDYFRLKP